MQVPGLEFGSGGIFLSPQTTSGNPAANPTPLQVGVVQNAKMTIGAEIKSLFGQFQWPVDSAIGKRSIKGSFEFAQLSNALMSQNFFSDPVTAGTLDTTLQPGELHAVPASTGPYTITVTNAVNPIIDLGVTYQASGISLENVGSGSLTAAGQYKVDLATGVYTFDAADALAEVYINYQWPVSGSGTTLQALTHPMGWGPVVGLFLAFTYEGGGIGFYLPNVRLGKIDLATKIDDYAMYTTDFEAFAGAAGSPFTSYQLF